VRPFGQQETGESNADGANGALLSFCPFLIAV